MIIRQGFKFRFYPEPQQRRVLACWWGGKRFVSNRALEERRSFSQSGRSLGYTKQAGDLKALRVELPWLADVPAQLLQQGLVDLDRAFQNFFEGRAKYPKPLRKYEDDSVRFPALEQRQVKYQKGPDGKTLKDQDGKPVPVLDRDGAPVWLNHKIIECSNDWIDLPKIGRVRWVMHRQILGTPKSVTLSRQGEMYFASVLTAREVPDPLHVAPLSSIGIDFGTRQDWTASTGHVFDVPGLSQGEQRRKLCLERGIARQVEMQKALRHQHRSRREAKRRAALRRLQGRETRRAHDALHKYTIDLAKRFALIGIEDLNIKNMTASAAGTLEEPGRNVAAKSGLNREMRHGRFGIGRRMLGYKSEWHGGKVVAVPPAYTSQTCSACEKHPKDHPETRHLAHGRDGERFRCPLCGHEENADINAARNIQREAIRLAVKIDQALPVPAQPRRERPKGAARFKKKLSTAGGLPVEARGALGASQAMNREVDSVARC
jgi:putative transposase